MKKTLVIFAHPYFEYSTANVELIKAYEKTDNIYFKDLYEEYPDFHIATFRERKRIRDFERLIFHFPLIWFGLPPLLKLWIDEVFDMKWITEDEHPLLNKDAIIVVTAGGKEENYTENSLYETTISNLLKTLTLSLKVNNIEVKEIIAIHNADELEEKELGKLREFIHKKIQIP
ncbi:NAD(P)H-dependent oxidoreductase [Kaistella montana]|uniref:NAD(P)H-dependent oxidoreductase n=1 Tax=Kaistella montana TaxID=1849733 RepID=A0ABW5KAP7_9FLAO|nr:NAD(P)H-dependent oxidoreductase [Kaistella montana]MCQ4036246.1 NAD(P)H-dependent oxidoreductase [Kaistella montana]